MSAMASQQRSRKALGLWMNGHFVGTWSLEAGGDVLQYDSQWVQSPQRRPLSLSLPFTPGNRPHKGNAVRFYFENLLPDSKDIRERVARRYQVGATDAYTLLREVGRDCVGALQILPAGDEPPTDLRVQAEPMSDHAVAQRIRIWPSPGHWAMRAWPMISAFRLRGRRKRMPCCSGKGAGAAPWAPHPPPTSSNCPWG